MLSRALPSQLTKLYVNATNEHMPPVTMQNELHDSLHLITKGLSEEVCASLKCIFLSFYALLKFG